MAVERESGRVRRRLPVPVAAAGLAWRDGFFWLAYPTPMIFDAAAGSFEWAGDERRFALVQLDPNTGREVAGYELDFLALGLAWVNDELWLAPAGQGELVCGRVE